MRSLPIFVVASMDKSESGILIRIRDIYSLTLWHLHCLRSSLEPEERPRKKPRILFTPERIKGLPVKVIEIDPEGDLSSLKKIDAEDHYVLDYRPARLRILHYVRNQYVDPTPKIVAHRAWRKSQQTGHFPLAGLLTIVVAKEGADGVHGNSGSGHGSWGWLTP